MMVLILFVALTCLLAVATLLPLAKLAIWPVRMFDFPRLQIAVLCILHIIAMLVFMGANTTVALILISISLACLGYQLWWIFPYTPLHPCEVKSCSDPDNKRSISIVTANVLTSNHGADALLKQIHEFDPDILVTLESDQWWQTQLDTLASEYPHSLKCPLDNLYGMHLYSKLPLHDANIDFLVEDDKPSMNAQVELRSGDKIHCHFLHPAPPSPTENEESSERDAELLLVARNIEEVSVPVIVTGDLNDVAWSRTTRAFRHISGLLDPRIGRGMFNTFHAKHWFLRWPLDHIFHSDHFTLIHMQRLRPFGSDHFALFTHLAFTPHQNRQTCPEPSEAEQEFARRKISQQGKETQTVHEPGVSG